MASVVDSERKCFTFIWKLENASYCWQSCVEYIESLLFTVDEIRETNWKLQLSIPVEGNNDIAFWLERQPGNKGEEDVEIDCEIAFLSSDGTVLRSWEEKNSVIEKNGNFGTLNFALRNQVFFEERSVFLPQDTLTARCRMWKSAGEMSKDVQCFARTHIAVEKRSLIWNIKNFSTLEEGEKETFEIKSYGSGKSLMSIELFLTRRLVFDVVIRFKVIPHYQIIKMCTLQLSILDTSKNVVKFFQDEFWYHDSCGNKDFELFYTRSELLEKKSIFLPNDVLSLSCECAFSFGIPEEEIKKVDSEYIASGKKEPDNHGVYRANQLSDPKCILLDNLRSMINNSCVSDVKLKTKNQTYPSHTFILSARSPVFKAMFSNDMKEKIKECVDIEDLNDETVLRMLLYIYSADVEELEWTSAIELYEAADKYEILDLKDICSSYLKRNLRLNNACEALILADLHQDEDLKDFVQDFILRHGKDIISSEEWDQLMETNLKLAAETMRRKFKE